MLESLECATSVEFPTEEALVDFQAVPTDTCTFDSEKEARSPSAVFHQMVDSVCSIARNKSDLRAEIDTSAPFESVKEATTRFGGFGFWKPNHNNKLSKDEDHVVVDEDAFKLEKDLIVKEREALEVLEELEITKNAVENLKLKLQKEISDDCHVNPSDIKEDDEEKYEFMEEDLQRSLFLILMELRQTQQNISQSRNILSGIRATVDSYNKKLEKERTSVEKTRERLISNWSKIAFLEKQLNQTQFKLEVAKNGEIGGTASLEKLEKMEEEEAKSEVSSLKSEIEETRRKIKTSELRLVAAKKMKEADRASEAFAVAERKALSPSRQSCSITLSFKEYSSLMSKAGEAAEHCRKKISDAMVGVDEAEDCEIEHLKMENDAKEEAIMSGKALEAALNRAESAEREKACVEEEVVRKWRSESEVKRCPLDALTDFNNESDCELYNTGVPVLRPSLSIGEILSRKLLASEEFVKGGGGGGGKMMWLGQMLKGEMYGCHKMKVGAKR